MSNCVKSVAYSLLAKKYNFCASNNSRDAISTLIMRLLSTARLYCGRAMPANMPIIKTTTNSSMSVNPFLIFTPTIRFNSSKTRYGKLLFPPRIGYQKKKRRKTQRINSKKPRVKRGAFVFKNTFYLCAVFSCIISTIIGSTARIPTVEILPRFCMVSSALRPTKPSTSVMP